MQAQIVEQRLHGGRRMAGEERSSRGDNRLAQPLESPDMVFASGQRVATTPCAGPTIDGRAGSIEGAEAPATAGRFGNLQRFTGAVVAGTA